MKTNEFIAELGKLHDSATFLTVKGYLSAQDELADYSLVFHMSYENALKKSIQQLKSMKLDSKLERQAKNELIVSFNNSLNKGSSDMDLAGRDPHFSYYTRENGSLIKGIKQHISTNALHLYGSVVHKKVLMPGFPYDNKGSELSQTKSKLRSKTAVGKFRSFIIAPGKLDSIQVQNISLLPPE